jgi:hypothetical protein
MALRMWRTWGMSIVLTGGIIAVAQSPKTEVNGRATPPITQDHCQPETAPPPRLLSQRVREANPSKTAPPTAAEFKERVVGFGCPGVPTRDLDVPIRLTSFGTLFGASRSEVDPGFSWKGRAALAIAEMHHEACEIDEARPWYEEAIKLAPGTKCAAIAAERLRQTSIIPAGGQSAEPPLADADIKEFQVRRLNR